MPVLDHFTLHRRTSHNIQTGFKKPECNTDNAAHMLHNNKLKLNHQNTFIDASIHWNNVKRVIHNVGATRYEQ